MIILKKINKKTAFIAMGTPFIFSAFANPALSQLDIAQQSVVLTPGQTVRVNLLSYSPPSGDLTANGHFQNNDVSFTDGPECHLSAHNCTLWITAAPTSKDYTAVPVIISESAASNTPVFAVSVIHPGESLPRDIHLPLIISTPIKLSSQEGLGQTFQVKNTSAHKLTDIRAFDLPTGVTSSECPVIAPGGSCTIRLAADQELQPGHYVISIQSEQKLLQDRILNITPDLLLQNQASSIKNLNRPVQATKAVLQRSGNSLFYGIAEPHPSQLLLTGKDAVNYFTAQINGPVYQIVALTNHDQAQPLSISITGPGATSFSIDQNTLDYGAQKNCGIITSIASGDSCLLIIKGKIGNPSQAPKTATLTLKGNSGNISTFTLTDTTYVYAGGGFNTLGAASVSGGNLLAQCTAGACSNALGDTGNYASMNLSRGSWINALAVTPAGNLIVGGVFGAIGGATSQATGGVDAALLAQCTPGVVTGNSCFNQIIDNSGTPYATSNGYIDAITAPILIAPSNYFLVGGDFNVIKGLTVSNGGRMLARCVYSGSSRGSCTNYMSNMSRYANNAISALDSLGSSAYVGGLFTQIANYPSSPPSSGTTFAACTTSTCTQGMGGDNPNGSILGMTDDGTHLYMGGAFTGIGGYGPTTGYPLVECITINTTTCVNALTNNANGYIEGLAYSEGYLYVGGQFTTIGGSEILEAGRNMLAVCTPGGECQNFVTRGQNYASGNNFGGEIAAIAVGVQTGISAN